MNIGLIPLESKPAKYFSLVNFLKSLVIYFLRYPILSGIFLSNFMKMFSTVTVEHLKI